MKHFGWRRHLLTMLFGGLLLPVARAQILSSPPQTNCIYDLSAVTQAFTKTLSQAGIANGSLLILKDGQKLDELYAGLFNPDTVRLIASSTKWLSAVVIMSLVDDGLMSLDDPVARYFPLDYTGVKGTMTLLQMFSHTSGLPGDETSDVLSDNTITLYRATQLIATNLTSWTNLFDLAGTNGLWQIPTPMANSPCQFIRAKRLP